MLERKADETDDQQPETPLEVAGTIVEAWRSLPDDKRTDDALTRMIAGIIVNSYDCGVIDGRDRLELRIATMNFTARSELVRMLQEKWKQKDSSLFLGTIKGGHNG